MRWRYSSIEEELIEGPERRSPTATGTALLSNTLRSLALDLGRILKQKLILVF
jgi:hypothetical protein